MTKTMVRNLVADGWCAGCQKARGYTYTLAQANDPTAVELPETCTCDGTVSTPPSGAPTVTVHGHVSEGALRAMVRGLVAEALKDVKNVREVPDA